MILLVDSEGPDQTARMLSAYARIHFFAYVTHVLCDPDFWSDENYFQFCLYFHICNSFYNVATNVQ